MQPRPPASESRSFRSYHRINHFIKFLRRVEAGVDLSTDRRLRRTVSLDPTEAMFLMTPAIFSFFRDTTFDCFLFAEVGEERNGMLLSVLSALARLDLDPWREAASLSKLPTAAATERLSSLLSSLPSSQLTVPEAGRDRAPRWTSAQGSSRRGLVPDAAVLAKSRMSWPMVVYFIIAFVMMCAAQFAERRELNAPAAGGASPAMSAAGPGAGKARANRKDGVTSKSTPRRRYTFPYAPASAAEPRKVAEAGMRSFRISPEDNRYATLAAAIEPTRSRGAAMSNYTVMIPAATPGDALSSPPYGTLEDALRGAKFMLVIHRFHLRWKRQFNLACRAGQIADGFGRYVEPFGGSNDGSRHSPVSVHLGFVASRRFRLPISALLIAGFADGASPAKPPRVVDASRRERVGRCPPAALSAVLSPCRRAWLSGSSEI